MFVGLVGGNLIGLLLAQQLLPSVAASLNDLYNANVGLQVHWNWQWGAASLAIAIFGCAFACTWPVVRLIKSPPARLATHLSLVRFSGREFAWQALFSCIFIIGAVIVYKLAHGQLTGFVLIAFILIASGLMMPYLLWLLFHFLGNISSKARMRWFFFDAAASLSYRGIAAMAFMLALASNIGMETMVGSFRNTTENWLEQRLAADIYIRPSMNMAPRISKWLQQQPEVDQLHFERLAETYAKVTDEQGQSIAITSAVMTTFYTALEQQDWLVTNEYEVNRKVSHHTDGKASLVVCSAQYAASMNDEGELVKPLSLYVRGNVQQFIDTAYQHGILLFKITDYKSKVKLISWGIHYLPIKYGFSFARATDSNTIN